PAGVRPSGAGQALRARGSEESDPEVKRDSPRSWILFGGTDSEPAATDAKAHRPPFSDHPIRSRVRAPAGSTPPILRRQERQFERGGYLVELARLDDDGRR